MELGLRPWAKHITVAAGSLLALGGCSACRDQDGGTSSRSAPVAAAPALINRVWVSSESASAPGTMRVFLSDGTLLMDSCFETYRLAKWRALEGQRVAWEEDGIPIEAQIAELGAERLRLRLQLRGSTRDEAYRVAPSPYVCPDMPR